MRIAADLLIPGRGDPVRDGVVVLDGARIAYAGGRAAAPRTDEPETRVRTLMPGLWDCHVHFLGIRGMDLEEIIREPQALLAVRAGKSVEAVLRAGFTSVREVGGYGVQLAMGVDEGTTAGPTIYAAGAVLSQTGGHADLHGMSLATMADYSEHGGALQLCDGIAECQRAVRRQLRNNARVIKVCASGGVLSVVDDPVHQQFSDDELKAIVDEAGRADRVVAAHCHGKPGIMAALRAGCRTIERGSYLDEEAAAAMREAKAILVSTRSIVARILGALDRVPPYAAAKLRATADRHLESMHTARAAGVTIACGTDFATVGETSLVPHGRNGEELAHLVAAGYTPLEAIEAATANAPLTLGPQAPRSGLLAEGYDADLIALDMDPLADISALADQAHITHVWKGGRAVKSPVDPEHEHTGAQMPDKETIKVEMAGGNPNLSPATRFGNLVFVAGQTGRHPTTGQVGQDIREQTRNVLERIKVVLGAAGTSLDNVLTVTTYLTNRQDLAAYNEEYAKYFPNAKPARTTVTVASLNAPELVIEITVTACVPS